MIAVYQEEDLETRGDIRAENIHERSMVIINADEREQGN